MDEGRGLLSRPMPSFRAEIPVAPYGISDADANYDIPFGVEDEQIKFTAVRGMQRIGAMLDSEVR